MVLFPVITLFEKTDVLPDQYGRGIIIDSKLTLSKPRILTDANQLINISSCDRVTDCIFPIKQSSCKPSVYPETTQNITR